MVTTRSNKLLAQLEIDDLEFILTEKRLRWFKHVECSDIQIAGKSGLGVAQDVMEDIERECREWNLNEVDPCDKDVWRSSVRSVMRATNQLPGREPTDVDDAPAPAH